MPKGLKPYVENGSLLPTIVLNIKKVGHNNYDPLNSNA